VHIAVVEWPQIYQRGGGRTKGDPNDQLPLAAIGGALAAMLSPETGVYRVRPHDWKGSIGKPSTTGKAYAIKDRVLQRLSEDERRAVDWTTNVRHSWDVADAIGIGLWHLVRFDRFCVYAAE
jgi:hypothetical protein